MIGIGWDHQTDIPIFRDFHIFWAILSYMSTPQRMAIISKLGFPKKIGGPTWGPHITKSAEVNFWPIGGSNSSANRLIVPTKTIKLNRDG